MKGLLIFVLLILMAIPLALVCGIGFFLSKLLEEKMVIEARDD